MPKTKVLASDPYLLGPSRILIQGNGSKWAGGREDPLSKLFERLEQCPLDPRWEECGEFAWIAHDSIRRRQYDDKGTFIGYYYEDAGPIYDDAPYAVEFCGNFYGVSAGFSIVTDDPEIVEVLLEAIHKNQQSPAYQQAKIEVENRRREREARGPFYRRCG